MSSIRRHLRAFLSGPHAEEKREGPLRRKRRQAGQARPGDVLLPRGSTGDSRPRWDDPHFLATAAGGPEGSPLLRAAPSRKPVVLIGTDGFGQQALALLLASEGYPVTMHASDEDALSSLGLTPLPGLILLDVDRPRRTGLQLCRRLRQREHLSAIPLVVISAGERLSGALAVSHGILAQLQKPARPATLLETVQRFCA